MEMTEGHKLASEALDREYPGWEKRIDLERLDMFSIKDCLLGQLNPESARGGWTAEVIRLVGWDTNSNVTPTTYFACRDEEWKQLIQERLSQKE